MIDNKRVSKPKQVVQSADVQAQAVQAQADLISDLQGQIALLQLQASKQTQLTESVTESVESKMESLLKDSRIVRAELNSTHVQFLQNLIRENPIYSPEDTWNPGILLTVLQAHNDRRSLEDALKKQTIHTSASAFEITKAAIEEGSFKTCESGITSGFTAHESSNFAYLSLEIPIVSRDCMDLPSKIFTAFQQALKSACWNAAKPGSGNTTSWYIPGKGAYKSLYILDPRLVTRGTRVKAVSDFRLAYPKTCFSKHVSDITTHVEMKHVVKISLDVSDTELVEEFLTPADLIEFRALSQSERNIPRLDGALIAPRTKIVI